jgi:hypothetical protein
MRRIGPLLLVGIISSAVPATALAFNEPDSFRGVPWGATEELLKGRINVRDCSDYPPEQQMLGERRCSGGWRWDDDLFLEVTYSLRRDRFVSVTLSFKSRDFERIEDWFVGLYGSPSSDRTTTSFKTRDGLEVTNRILNWMGPVITISLFRFISGTTHGFAIIETRAEREESDELRRRKYDFQCDLGSYWDSVKGECVKIRP